MKTIYKLLILMLIPAMYYVLVSGYLVSNEENNTTANNTAGPTVTAPKDFVLSIYNGNIAYTPDSMWVLQQTAGSNYGLYYDRCKISQLCYAQRLVYEIAPNGGSSTVNDGFCYRNCTGIYEEEPDGRTVLHACTGNCINTAPTAAGYLAQNIYENLQQNIIIQFNPILGSDRGTWYVKPMLRIKQSDFRNDDTTPVVSISVYNPKLERIDSIVIQVRNFSDRSGNYSGAYQDSYMFEIAKDLQFTGNDLFNGYESKKSSTWPDVKIYWFGLVDTWFDEVTIDDRLADGLFEGRYDYHIIRETTPEVFIMTALKVKGHEFRESNYKSVNYVMSVMYDKLKNQAGPLPLKYP
jgi:hypothetical protein